MRIIISFLLAMIVTLGSPILTQAQSGQNLVGFVTLDDVVTAIDAEKNGIAVSSFLLEPYGPVAQALIRARKRGVTVAVWLPASPYDPQGMVRKANSETETALRAVGGKVIYTSFNLHLKSVMVHGATFLDDRNWAKSGKQVILVDKFPADQEAILKSLQGGRGQTSLLTTIKSDSLDREARIIALGGHPLNIETESFNDGPISQAIIQAISQGADVQLIVASNEFKSAKEQAFVADMIARANGHLKVNVSSNSEKMAISGSSCWVGSTNATSGVEDQVDWGMEMRGQACATLAADFQNNLSRSRTNVEAANGTTHRRKRLSY